ncbi:hypothetical protein V2O64_23190 [Verrucomicrobiaceae bacterium 227]
MDKDSRLMKINVIYLLVVTLSSCKGPDVIKDSGVIKDGQTAMIRPTIFAYDHCDDGERVYWLSGEPVGLSRSGNVFRYTGCLWRRDENELLIKNHTKNLEGSSIDVRVIDDGEEVFIERFQDFESVTISLPKDPGENPPFEPSLGLGVDHEERAKRLVVEMIKVLVSESDDKMVGIFPGDSSYFDELKKDKLFFESEGAELNFLQEVGDLRVYRGKSLILVLGGDLLPLVSSKSSTSQFFMNSMLFTFDVDGRPWFWAVNKWILLKD